jgi:hypothetical protein
MEGGVTMRLEAVSGLIDLTLPIWDDLSTLDLGDASAVRELLELIEIAQVAGGAVEKVWSKASLCDGVRQRGEDRRLGPDGSPEPPEIGS